MSRYRKPCDDYIEIVGELQKHCETKGEPFKACMSRLILDHLRSEGVDVSEFEQRRKEKRPRRKLRNK